MRKLRFKFNGFHIICPYVKLIRVNAITIFPFVFYKSKYIKQHQITYNHEVIHIHQQMECGLVGLSMFIVIGLFVGFLIALPALFLFYILYGLFYVINLIRGHDRWNAYRFICFETEAYHFANIYKYTVVRDTFHWIKFINFKKVEK